MREPDGAGRDVADERVVGRFGETVAVLPKPVEMVATDGAALVRAITP